MNRAADDLISRKQAIKEILAFCPEETKPGSLDEYGVAVLSGIIEVVLKRLPAADAVPVTHGLWISFNCAGNELYQCSECFHWIDAKTDKNYCPNCGAKMENNNEQVICTS